MTAMSEPAYLGEKAPFLNFATVKAVIRKDMRTLWPLASAVAALSFMMATFFHDESDFPSITIDFGNGTLHVGTMLFVGVTILLWVGTALFVVMLAQQDRATDVRNDWMARPIKAGELVLAKVFSAGGAVLVPTTLGALIYVLINPENVDLALTQIFLALMACTLFLALGWLCSGTVQALFATAGMVVLTFAMGSISAGLWEVRQSFREVPRAFAVERAAAAERPMRVPSPIPPPARPADRAQEFVQIEQTRVIQSSNSGWTRALPLVGGIFLMTLAGVGVTLWLLLGRRQVLTARVCFVSLYAVSVLVLTQSLDRVDISVSVPAATLEQRMAAFRKNDANGDLKLDKAEYDKVLNDLGFGGQLNTYWPQRDVNNDGFITAEEMQRDLGVLAPAATLEQRMTAFTQNDADKDGKLTKDEYAAALKVLGYSNQLEEYWLQRDLNKDGFISVEEYVPAMQGAPAIQPTQF
jgi:Ca2+-binding EF-hand superfamily protein